ncbi:ionotropic receptor 21a [Hyalella azteca]|uniref:Ionotropic receptor 21a n=1 Tax=Hyalella azteca TaxID=294128 RepID=A0A8B7NG02_HYAAZ|nr:ionotropic receptor 21a [Hyalella azteca]
MHGSHFFFHLYFCSDSIDPTSREIYEGFQFVSGIDSGIARVLHGDFAFMNSGRFLRYLVASNFTDVYGQAKLHVTKECFVPFRIGFATPLFSVYTGRFSEVINRLVEAGLVTKWFNEILQEAAQQQRLKARHELGGLGSSITEEPGASVVLGLYHLQGAFILLLSGLCFSFLGFIGELISITYVRSRMRGNEVK